MQIAYRLASALAGLILMVGGCLYIGHLRAEIGTAREEAKSAQEAMKKAQATLAYREKLRAASARAEASARASLSAAAASNPAWAEAPVPQEVQDALCAHLDCAGRPDGVREPASNDSP
jgi:hypothetical protein